MLSCATVIGKEGFSRVDTVEDFGSYLFAGRLSGCICSAHNSSGYDSHFMLDFVHRKAIKPSVITTGHKVLRVEAEGVTFIDSLSVFPMALPSCPRLLDWNSNCII